MGKKIETMDELERLTLDERPELRKRWQEGKARRDLALMLTRLRTDAELTQSELAERLGWDQPRVSRMESVSGPQPTAESVASYAKACGADAGYVFAVKDTGGASIRGAVGFGDDSNELLNRLVRDRDDTGEGEAGA